MEITWPSPFSIEAIGSQLSISPPPPETSTTTGASGALRPRVQYSIDRPESRSIDVGRTGSKVPAAIGRFCGVTGATASTLLRTVGLTLIARSSPSPPLIVDFTDNWDLFAVRISVISVLLPAFPSEVTTYRPAPVASIAAALMSSSPSPPVSI